MKIALIIGNREGGLVQYASQLANALGNICNLSVIVPKGVNRECFDMKISVQEIDFSIVGKLLHKEILSVDNLTKNILNINPDVIHILSPHISICLAIPFFRRFPCVITIHNPATLFPVTPRFFHLLILDVIINSLYVKYADLLIVHGKTLKEILQGQAPKKNIRVIPHGDYSFFTKWARDNIKEDKSILFFGFIAPHKGIEYLIKAEPLIEEKITGFKIIVAGKGDFKKYGWKIKNKNHFEIYNYFIPNEQVAELFQKASIVVLPYIKASQTGVIPIAYAFKKPVIATRVGSIPEVVDDGVTGFIVPPKNPEALAEAIIRLLRDDELRKQMGENAYKKMKDELSWDKIAEKTIEVYKEAIRIKHATN